MSILMGFKSFYKVKRNLHLESNKPGAIFIGFNNQIPDRDRAFFWNYDSDDNGVKTEQDSPLSESILVDELDIKNYRLQTRDITKNYLKSDCNAADNPTELILIH